VIFRPPEVETPKWSGICTPHPLMLAKAKGWGLHYKCSNFSVELSARNMTQPDYNHTAGSGLLRASNNSLCSKTHRFEFDETSFEKPSTRLDDCVDVKSKTHMLVFITCWTLEDAWMWMCWRVGVDALRALVGRARFAVSFLSLCCEKTKFIVIVEFWEVGKWKLHLEFFFSGTISPSAEEVSIVSRIWLAESIDGNSPTSKQLSLFVNVEWESHSNVWNQCLNVRKCDEP
jgi:hypothetical protein